MHVAPALVTWTLRWHRDPSRFGAPPGAPDAVHAQWEHADMVHLVLLPLLPHLTWAVSYYMKVWCMGVKGGGRGRGLHIGERCMPLLVVRAWGRLGPNSSIHITCLALHQSGCSCRLGVREMHCWVLLGAAGVSPCPRVRGRRQAPPCSPHPLLPGLASLLPHAPHSLPHPVPPPLHLLCRYL